MIGNNIQYVYQPSIAVLLAKRSCGTCLTFYPWLSYWCSFWCNALCFVPITGLLWRRPIGTHDR